MISIDEIDRTILECESRDTSFANCERLAWLYIVRDHISPKNVKYNSPMTGDSEFIRAAAKSKNAWEVINEHMMALKIVNPKAYNSVLQKLQG